jgi:4-amino-4-deoxy-L-arabinose transferase-like glycosyltransferase
MSKKRTVNIFLQPLPLIITLALLQLSMSLLYFHFTFDEAMWEYIGRNWFRHGLVPYTGGVDNKSPLIYLLFGLSDKLFGANYWFPRLVGTFVQSAGIYFVYKIATRLANEQAGIFAVTVYGLSLLWKSTDGVDVSLTQTYAVTFILMAVYGCISGTKGKEFFLAGLLAGLGFGFRFSAGFGIAAICVFLFRKSLKFTVYFLTGLISSVLAQAILLYLSGVNLFDFLAYAFTDNFGSGSITDRNFTWRLENFVHAFFYTELILFYPLVAAYFFIRKKVDFLAVWLICEFIGINVLSMYATAHFKNLLPVLSIMSGLSISHLIETYKVPLKPLLVIVWISFFPKTLEPLVGLKK